MYDSSDFSTITTSPPASSAAPYSEYRPVSPLTCIPSFCCKSGSNGKTQRLYWLATNQLKFQVARKNPENCTPLVVRVRHSFLASNHVAKVESKTAKDYSKALN
jgi:hypothetical protein